MVGPEELDEEGERYRVVEDGVVVKPTRQLERRGRDVLGREHGHRFKAALHATQLVRKETATVHHADLETGVALEPSLIVWLGTIVIMSLASFAVSVAATIVGDITEPGQIGARLGQFRFVGDLGLITGPLVVSALFEGVGRAAAFGFVALVLTVTALLSWRLLPNRHSAQDEG